MNFHKTIVPISILLLAAILIGCIYYLSDNRKGMLLDFEEVQNPNRKEEYASLFHGKGYLPTEIQDATNEIIPFALRKKGVESGNIKINTTQKKYYIYKEKAIFEYDFKDNLLRQISISDLGFSPEDDFIHEIAEVNNDTIWITIYEKGKTHWKKARLAIIEWQLDRSPESRQLVQTPDVHAGFIDVIINPDLRHAVIINNLLSHKSKDAQNVFVYDLNEQKYIKEFSSKGASFAFYDFDKEKGILLSGHTPSSSISVLNPTNYQIKHIAVGNNARWGSDGCVYFLKGVSQIWKCNSDGTNKEPVYIFSRRTKIPVLADLFIEAKDRLLTSTDKSLLVFFYTSPITFKQNQHGALFMDLKAMEYLVVPRAKSAIIKQNLN
ncbi:MAG: hypothetical protein ACYTE8_07280 [Planctomycetota bacterium]|jgi:hypothetical protein